MNTVFLSLTLLTHIFSQYQCAIPSCSTNCTIIEQCWREALAYRSSELIEQLFSFSSLSVHVNTYQRQHTNEVNDSTLLIDETFESYLLNETTNQNLSMDLFNETKILIVNLCTNLTATEIATVRELPPLTCSLSTCSSDTINFTILFIISIFITSFILLICTIYSFQTYHKANLSRKIVRPISLENSFSLNSNRF